MLCHIAEAVSMSRHNFRKQFMNMFQVGGPEEHKLQYFKYCNISLVNLRAKVRTEFCCHLFYNAVSISDYVTSSGKTSE